MEFGDILKQLRKERGMTQERLAELVGISFQAISKWENNLALPDITLIPQLAAIFGVTTDELFSYNLKQNQEEIEDYAARAFVFRETDAAKAREKKHMTFTEAADIARKAGPKQMWLTHYSPSLIKPDEFMPAVRKIFPDSHPGKDGKTITLTFENEDTKEKSSS